MCLGGCIAVFGLDQHGGIVSIFSSAFTAGILSGAYRARISRRELGKVRRFAGHSKWTQSGVRAESKRTQSEFLVVNYIM